MIKHSKVGALILTAAILLGSFTGCASKDPGTSSQGSTSSGTSTAANTQKDIVQISMLVHDRGAIPSSEGTLEENWFTKEVNKRTQEKLGIKVKFVPVPNAQREQKLATMMAASEAPDICFSYDQAMIQNYSRNGGLLDIAPYLDKYGVDITKLIGANRLEQSKIDGKLTRIFDAAILPADYTWIRADWLAKLNMKEPTNVDEFYAYLKAVKEKDPGNVGKDLIPFLIPSGGDTPFNRVENTILPGFLKEAPSAERLAGVPVQLWPELKETYRFLNKLYNEKLMGEVVIDKDQAQYKQMLMKGQIGATPNFSHYMYDAAYGNILENLQKNVPDANMVGIFPWTSSSYSGDKIYGLFLYGVGGAMSHFIPKSAKHPEAAVQFLNYMATDEYINLVNSGIEGKDYTVVDGINTPVNQDDFKNHVSWAWGAYYAMSGLYVNDTEKYKKSNALKYLEKYRADYMKYVVAGDEASKYAQPVISVARPVYDKNYSNLNLKWTASTTKFVLCPENEFDKNYDEALNTWKAEGGNDLAKEAIEVYKQQYSK